MKPRDRDYEGNLKQRDREEKFDFASRNRSILAIGWEHFLNLVR